jgi:hypothetical protein
LLSSFAFKLCFQALLSSLAIKLYFQAWLSNFAFNVCLQLQLRRYNKVFGGEVRKYSHASESTGTAMTFSVFVPPAAALAPVPVLYYLSGLTCTAWADTRALLGYVV